MFRGAQFTSHEREIPEKLRRARESRREFISGKIEHETSLRCQAVNYVIEAEMNIM